MAMTVKEAIERLGKHLAMLKFTHPHLVPDSLFESLKAISDATTWQPIESAPKDGTPILAFCEYDRHCIYQITVVNWRPELGRFVSVEWINGSPNDEPPTHWQPLPAGPEVNQEVK